MRLALRSRAGPVTLPELACREVVNETSKGCVAQVGGQVCCISNMPYVLAGKIYMIMVCSLL